jgi:hypothetical protein
MLKLIIGGVLGWGAALLKEKGPSQEDVLLAEVLPRLAYINALEQRNDALATLHKAKQHALYAGQTLEDILDDDWLDKPRRGRL